MVQFLEPPSPSAPRPPKIEYIDINKFLKYILSLQPEAFPAAKAVIQRIQTHQRMGLEKDLLLLLNDWLAQGCP